MKSLRIFLGIAFLFHTLYILGADHLRLLPQPQQCVLAKGYFVVGKMQLSTPVLSQEWKQFVTEMGGTLTDQSVSSINIKLVDAIDKRLKEFNLLRWTISLSCTELNTSVKY